MAPRAEASKMGVKIWLVVALPLVMLVLLDCLGVFPAADLFMPLTEEESIWPEALVAGNSGSEMVLVVSWNNVLLASLISA